MASARCHVDSSDCPEWKESGKFIYLKFEWAMYHIYDEWLWVFEFFFRFQISSGVAFRMCFEKVPRFHKPVLLLNSSSWVPDCFGILEEMSWLASDVCANPFCSITGSPFAYTEYNEPLIRRCHLPLTVAQSKINSWSSRARKEQTPLSF